MIQLRELLGRVGKVKVKTQQQELENEESEFEDEESEDEDEFEDEESGSEDEESENEDESEDEESEFEDEESECAVINVGNGQATLLRLHPETITQLEKQITNQWLLAIPEDIYAKEAPPDAVRLTGDQSKGQLPTPEKPSAGGGVKERGEGATAFMAADGQSSISTLSSSSRERERSPSQSDTNTTDNAKAQIEDKEGSPPDQQQRKPSPQRMARASVKLTSPTEGTGSAVGEHQGGGR